MTPREGVFDIRLIVAEPIRMIAQTRRAAFEAIGVTVVGIAATEAELLALAGKGTATHVLLGASEPGPLTPLDRPFASRLRDAAPAMVIASIVDPSQVESLAPHVDADVVLVPSDLGALEVEHALRVRRRYRYSSVMRSR